MRQRLAQEELAELALWMRGIDTEGWTERALHAAVTERGWRWETDGDRVRLGTGMVCGDGWLEPTKVPRYCRDGESYVAMAVPVGRAEADTAAQAACFRDVASCLEEALGPPQIMGSYGPMGPFFEPRLSEWGAYYERWRGPVNSLELRPGNEGPYLALHPTAPVETWMWSMGTKVDPTDIEGFLAFRWWTPDGAGDVANDGLETVPAGLCEDWDRFHRKLTRFLGELPAATTALGIRLSVLVIGERSPMFSLACSDRLEIVCLGAEAGTAPPGWVRETEVPLTQSHAAADEVALHSGAFAPGEVPGERLAEMFVTRVRARGVASPSDMRLGIGSRTITVDGGKYDTEFYGMALQ